MTHHLKPTDPEPFEINTLGELYEALERHDWFTAMSDDHRVWAAGEARRDTLMEAAGRIDGGEALLRGFTAHVYSGEPWGTVKQPKPERPE